MQLFWLLLILVVLDKVYGDLFFDIIENHVKTNVSNSKRSFTLKRHYFNKLNKISNQNQQVRVNKLLSNYLDVGKGRYLSTFVWTQPIK